MLSCLTHITLNGLRAAIVFALSTWKFIFIPPLVLYTSYKFYVKKYLGFLDKKIQIAKCLFAVTLNKIMLLLLITRPLPRDGNMAGDHGAPEAGKLSRVWTRGRREIESRQRVSGARSL